MLVQVCITETDLLESQFVPPFANQTGEFGYVTVGLLLMIGIFGMFGKAHWLIHRYNGVMEKTGDKLYTAMQVRGIDYAAIHESGIAGYDLMCRAGAAVVAHALKYFPDCINWLVMCGPGNNGGDGYVVARLAVDAGIRVTVCSLLNPEKLKGDAAQACNDWQARGGQVRQWPMTDDAAFDLALDAMLGTGIDRQVDGEFRRAINYLNRLDCPRLAIDIPSGLNADTGCVMGCAVRALLTVTFVGRKRGMYTADGPDCCGHIEFDNLAIPERAAGQQSAGAGALLTAAYLTEVIEPRSRNTHKGSFGHVLAVGGMAGMSGAIRLCGEAALRSGAGRVTLLTDSVHAGFINLARPELMVKAIGADGELPVVPGVDHVIAVGPGLGVSPWSESLFRNCLEAQAALVVDADGLNLLAQQMRREKPERGNWILTPHPAEAARLLSCTVTEIQQDRVDAAITLAVRLSACVVLKGCGTIVASPSGEYAICPLANPGMATAGSGDVLTGIIAALLGQKLSCFEAAKAGVLAHAMAGDIAAEKGGEMALIAGDIIDRLAAVWKSVET